MTLNLQTYTFKKIRERGFQIAKGFRRNPAYFKTVLCERMHTNKVNEIAGRIAQEI